MKGRRVAAAGAVVCLGVVGYGAADVFDLVPGFLTTAGAPAPPVPVPGTSTVGPSVAPPSVPGAPATVPASEAPVPVPSKLATALAKSLADKRLPDKVAVSVRDASSGERLFDKNSDAAYTPASITKLLSAWSVATTSDLNQTMSTKVVSGADGHIVLVAGGDTVLAPGKGDPTAIAGHAGVGDLAAQVATAVKKTGATTVTLDLDTSYAPGPLSAAKWTPDFLSMGYTARIAQLGLSTERSDPPRAAAADPARSVADTLISALGKLGVTAHFGSSVTAGKDAGVLGSVQSASLLDQLGLALEDSDNAMIESLTRQAAFRQGVPGDTASVVGWVESRLRTAGFDTAGLKMADVCGLSDGTTIPARLISDVLVNGTSGKSKPYQDVLSRLAVGGLNGTLHDRFQLSSNMSGAGDVRAKTGSLTNVSSLAGTVTDADGRLLVFTVITNGAPPSGVYAVRAAIDDIVVAMEGCGCR